MWSLSVMFNWEDYLTLAKELSDEQYTSKQEAALRSAISRAYYYAYNNAVQVLDRSELEKQKKKRLPQHVAVWSCFKNERYKNSLLAVTGHRLRRIRNHVDYDAELSFDLQAQWEKVLEEVMTVNKELERYRN